MDADGKVTGLSFSYTGVMEDLNKIWIMNAFTGQSLEWVDEPASLIYIPYPANPPPDEDSEGEQILPQNTTTWLYETFDEELTLEELHTKYYWLYLAEEN